LPRRGVAEDQEQLVRNMTDFIMQGDSWPFQMPRERPTPDELGVISHWKSNTRNIH
jgi:hypothetical protein